MTTIKPIIESLLFVSANPINVDQIKKALPEATKEEIQSVLNEIKEDFARRQGGVFLQRVAGGYQFRTPPEHKEWVQRLLQPSPARLSQAALETLAIIAYRQPVMRSEIEYIRGVNAGHTLRLLLERKLVRILGRSELPGRPLVYGTTRQFLETFNLNDLKDLPTPKDIESPQNPSKPGEQELPFSPDTDKAAGSKNNP